MEYTTLALTFSPDETYHYLIENGLELGLRGRTVDSNFFKKLIALEKYEDISRKTP
jgi:hypothetical protein